MVQDRLGLAGLVGVSVLFGAAAAPVQAQTATGADCAGVWQTMNDYGGMAATALLISRNCAIYSDANGSYSASMQPAQPGDPACTAALQTLQANGLTDHLYYLTDNHCEVPADALAGFGGSPTPSMGPSVAGAPTVAGQPAMAGPSLGGQPTLGGAPSMGASFGAGGQPAMGGPAAADPSQGGGSFMPGFQWPGAAATDVGAPPQGNTAYNDGVAEQAYRQVASVEVGKWPEGIALSGDSLIVAESGQRTISVVSVAAQRVVKTYTVGRLPVSVVATGSGKVFATINTDKKLWRVNDLAGPRDGVKTNIPDCPQDMTGGDGGLYILTWTGCSSGSGQVYRASAIDGGMSLLANVGTGPIAIADTSGPLIVTRTAGENSWLTFVDKQSGATYDLPVPGLRLHHVAASGDLIVAAGAQNGPGGETGVVIAVRNGTIVRQAPLAERVAALAADSTWVVAVSATGLVSIFDADTMTLRRQINTSEGSFAPHGIALRDDAILISTFDDASSIGHVFMIPDWQPGDTMQNQGGTGASGDAVPDWVKRF